MKILMKLLSDTIPGSGTNIAGIIDRDIVYDKFGIPYIPAKRMKGILRESAENLDINQIDEIFGKEGSNYGSNIKIDNGLIENYKSYVAFLDSKNRKNIFSPQKVLDFFTYTRSQTTIENGIAKENSLRISRVLKKDLKFEFNLECDEKYIDDMKNICKVTRNFGASRSRGFGEISLEVISDNKEGDNYKNKLNLNSDSKEIKKIVILLENEEQLFISHTVGKNQISENYIPGSVLLGAIATNYIKSGHKDSEEDFYEMFLSDEVSFSNFYPSNGNKKYYPAPLSVKKIKSIIKDNSEYKINDFIDLSEQDSIDGLMLKGGVNDFISSNKYKINIDKGVEVHHRRPKNRGIAKSTKKDGEFYQFEVIEKGQKFIGEIIAPESTLSKIISYFGNNDIIRLGKSKTGQYGRCKYKFLNIEQLNDIEWDFEDEIKIIFASDIILLNENGFNEPSVSLFVKEFTKKLNLKENDIELINQFVANNEIGGFMGVWRMPKIQRNALSAGTVLVLKNNSGRSLKFKPDFMFFGERTEEGFGRIMLYNNEKDKLKFEAEEIKGKKCEDINSVKNLIEHWLKDKIKEELLMHSMEIDKIVNINSFIGKINLILNSSGSFNDFERNIKKLDSNIQKKNIKKIEKILHYNADEIKRDEFKNLILTKILTIKDIDNDMKYLFNNMLTDESILFEFYKMYVIFCFTQIKLKNRSK